MDPTAMLVSDSRRRWRKRQRLASDAVGQVLAEGRGRAAGPLRLQYRANGLGFARLAQVIPKRLAPRAVDRNRVRRIVREVFRIEQARWAGHDCVVRLRSPYVSADDLRALAQRLIASGPDQD
jgi:ribonuclease P protein component